MKTLKFTSKELRALQELISNGYTICSSGCVYEEMKKSKKDCDKCEFTKSQYSILDKINGEVK